MDIDDDIFGLFKNINFSSFRPSMSLASLMKVYEANILRQLRTIIDARLEELAKLRTGGIPDMDPFTILGVSMDSTEEEVKEAYKKKAWEAHPDHGGSNEQMAKVNVAHEVIRRFKGWKS
jgi:DnaJ family protein C protein 3